MISKIHLKNVATYDQNGASLDDLKQINFIYGNNGAGKTTITELIRKEHNFPSCSLEWKDEKMVTYVYNRNFVNENFRLDNPIKGIFTLGKESVELKSKMDRLKEKIRSHSEDIKKLSNLYNQKNDEKGQARKDFKEKCWELKRQVDIEFKGLIEGYRNSKEKFMNKCLEESKNIKVPVKTIEEIKLKKESIFDRPIETVESYQSIFYKEPLENNYIFKQKIIGKEDVNIANLIIKLNISDWVQQGYAVIKETERLCPFCQQTLPNEFEEKLNNYFDQTYMQQIQILKDNSNQYKQNIESILNQIRGVITTSEDSFIDKEKITNLLQLIELKYDENKLLIEQKKKEPSRIIELVKVNELIESINNEILKANKKIKEHNKLIENVKIEKENLINDVWRYIIEKNKGDLTSFKQKEASIKKAMCGLERSIESKQAYKKQFEEELLKYQEQSTSVEHSVNEINYILNSFGFKNFRLATTSEKGNYKIIRNDGEEVKDTLSEGEKTFITFLYFYQLLNGSNNKEQIVTDKVVVIDDPISSLDSNVLFMVSSLIRQIMFEMKSNTSNIKQLFILTHNIYFHKEITFSQGKKSYGEGSFWIVRKRNNISSVQRYQENPIKTSYELLWKELKNKEHQSAVSIQNIMRRILENYFKFFGNISIDHLENKFELEEKMICRSLISWINDGSHFISEDMYVENNEDIIHRYFEVFKKIFIIEGHQAHYNMMMEDYGFVVSESEIIEQLPEEIEGRIEVDEAIKQVASGSEELTNIKQGET
ncbi:AAA family ATPase [Priestia aryabhattai]|uniref:AAA family ATPase n=1 Tax=Priestia aryabhattai TaxID=412384 RepID=UPI001C8F11A0|nr:AAA family ATPase [Priestia aryabhattai]MBY0008680.1 AAA family ATPase [Priestia aryabhattai]MBY0045296.1 AAA family ATPase [Priestia aryabhattai]